MKTRNTIALLFFITYPGFLIWMGYRPFQRNIIDPLVAVSKPPYANFRQFPNWRPLA